MYLEYCFFNGDLPCCSNFETINRTTCPMTKSRSTSRSDLYPKTDASTHYTFDIFLELMESSFKFCFLKGK